MKVERSHVKIHSKDARANGETEQRLYGLDAWRETPYYSARERAALEWTEALTLVSETSQAGAVEGVKNVVLVHGGFVDGSGWQGVYDLLKKDGYNVAIVQNPTTSLADDVAVTKRTLAAQNGPAILVGHSYGGVVVTEAGNDPKVAGLVYIAAFAPDKGESVSALIKNPPPGAPVPPILPPRTATCFSTGRQFRASFAADVSAEAAAFMADSQVPWGLEALNGAVSEPAWKSKPSWYLVSTEDRMIPPDAQRAMSKRAVRARSRGAMRSTCRSRSGRGNHHEGRTRRGLGAIGRSSDRSVRKPDCPTVYNRSAGG